MDRSLLKSKAKDALCGNYWWAFLACLLVTIITSFLSGSGSLGSGLTLNFNDFSQEEIIIDNGNIASDEFITAIIFFLLAFIIIVIICSVIGILISTFLLNPLNVGLKSYFMNQRENLSEISDVFYGFSNGNYLKTVGSIFTTNLFISLWSLLIFPGIYFSYAYYLVPYICAEKPGISGSEARRISKAITDGHKFDIFVMQLSFFGWRFLASIVIIGNYFLEPYVQATYAEMYAELRDEAIKKGIINPEEVGVTISEPEEEANIATENNCEEPTVE